MGYRLAGDHGEVLTLKSPTLDLAGMTLNRVKWLMPVAENTFKLGATYEWQVPISEPTESGKLELLDAISPALSPQISSSLEVINHQSGLRPTTHACLPCVLRLRCEGLAKEGGLRSARMLRIRRRPSHSRLRM